MSHAGLAVLLSAMLWRSLTQSWVDELSVDVAATIVLHVGILLANVGGSALAIVAGRLAGQSRRALATDVASTAALFAVVVALGLGSIGRDVVGLFFIAAVALRFAPAAAVAQFEPRRWSIVFVFAFSAYGLAAAWHQSASLPLGDQVHYLLVADRLSHGTLDATIDP